MSTKLITLGGRRFRPFAEPTLRQRLHIQKLLAESGLSNEPMEPGESTDRYAIRLLGKVKGNPLILEYLATGLLREGVTEPEWRPWMAREDAEFFLDLCGEDDVASIDGILAMIFVDFFRHGLVSSVSSPRFSEDQPGTTNRERLNAIGTETLTR